MNFFEAQDAARRNTLSLVILFCFAVLLLVVITNVLVLIILAYNQSGVIPTDYQTISTVFDWQMFWGIAIVVSLIIAMGSFYKMLSLSSGGKAVAESLGGRIVPQNSQDPLHRKLLNVVEEMAIASGSPVPSVYLLEENGINAFAAGWSPGNAVIGVTRGAVTYLTRDELQGVIAHEFSHIFNGDMKLNIRLISVLNGILILGMLGYYLMRSVRYMGRSQNKEGGSIVMAIFMLGLGLALIGYCGTFFGKWIKSIVSRQREYLADASAVQFTRNPDSIAGALKKIGGAGVGSKLLSPSAPEYSHAYFSEGISAFLFATHPPLDKRIRRIDPRWNGKFIAPERESLPETKPVTDNKPKKEALLNTITAVAIGTTVDNALQAIDNIGNPTENNFSQALEILANVPDNIKEEANDPFGARALVYCFIIHRNTKIQTLQWTSLEQKADPDVYKKTRQLYPLIAALQPAMRLPVFELCFPALKLLSAPQYKVFKENIYTLIAADKKLDIREWIIQRLIKRQLDEAHGLRKPPKAIHSHIGAVKRELELLLSMTAYIEHKDIQQAEAAFNASIRAVGATALKIVPRQDIKLKELDSAMDKLAEVRPLVKQRILKAIVACLAVDNKVTVTGGELLRVVGSCLDCPIPPLSKISSNNK